MLEFSIPSRNLQHSAVSKSLRFILVKKILNLRLFGNDDRKWTASVVDQACEVLCLSQITLYHSLKGNRLDFHHAMAPQQSQQFYQQFLTTLRQQYIPEKVKGRHGTILLKKPKSFVNLEATMIYVEESLDNVRTKLSVVEAEMLY
ncbi:D-tyrosyl-tRNA(Tyr) deacylase [Homalodisca vitripennis]|nr:D-tyrosyl-tRNA(Tyr) deacylase [Homalodisca vitripennis]